jgi:hypothetical protein
MSRNPKESPPVGDPAEMDDEMRAAYRALADGQPVISDLPGHVRKTVRKRRVRRFAAAGGTAAILLPAVLIIALAGGTQSEGDRQVIVTTPGPTAVRTPTATYTPTATETPTASVTKPPLPVVTETPTTSSGSPSPEVAATPQNLMVTPEVRQELIAAYETVRQLGPDGVTGTRPDSVYYAFDPATGIHWAVANFSPGPTLTEQQSVSFQDGGSIGVFSQAANSGWQLLGGGGAPPDCTSYLPATVRSVWNWPYGASCGGG